MRLRKPVTEAQILKRAAHDAVLDYAWNFLSDKKKRKALSAINKNREEENEHRILLQIDRLSKRIGRDTQTRDNLIGTSEEPVSIVDYVPNTDYALGTLVRVVHNNGHEICKVMESDGACGVGQVRCIGNDNNFAANVDCDRCCAEDRTDHTNIAFIPVSDPATRSVPNEDIPNFEFKTEYPIGTTLQHQGNLIKVVPDGEHSCSVCAMDATCDNATLAKHQCGHSVRSDEIAIHYEEIPQS
jgi:hypothetical protein